MTTTAKKTAPKTAPKTAAGKPAAKKPAARKPAAKKPAPKTAPPSANTDTAEIVMLPLQQLVASGLNPRKTFDDTSIAELADSIAAQGVLQNLVARRLPKKRGKATHEIVAGGRRLRALQLLAADKRLPADTPVPVRTVAGDDDDARAMAILENLQRENVPPVEEGEAFKLLRDAGWKSATIAERIGKTPRYVQNRIKVIDRLGPISRDALAAGDINLAQAEAICDAAPELQEDAIRCIVNGLGHWQREKDIRHSIRQEMVPLSYAIFEVDPDLVLEGEDGEPDLIRSRARFDVLQAAAVEKLQANLLEQGWTHAPIVSWFLSWDYQKRKKADGGHAIIEYNRTGEVKVHHGLISNDAVYAERKAAGAGKEDTAKPAKLFNQAQLDTGGEIKTRHLQNLVANAPETALRAAIFGMLSGGPVKITAHAHAGGDAETKYIATLLPLLRESTTDKDDIESFGELGYWPTYDCDGLWPALEKRDIPGLLDILAAIVGATMSVPATSAPGNEPDAIAIAGAAAGESGLPLNPAGTVDETYLKGARKPELLAIAAAAGVVDGLSDKPTMKAIRDAIGDRTPPEYVPISCRLATYDDAAAAIAAEFPQPEPAPDAGPEPEPAPEPGAIAAE